ncbi:MAG: 3-hydroxyisobutyrate dehydrogenase [Pseudomonadales bacterium]|jgi:3-hydroxyisobutyrate dehydrogenase|nr:3-hydroxyisobutyrate dehydrogenase [Pseudomonadales bacterium]MDP6471668.1 3-hydroxyisobutyrate dehydrogenase [Pseudomonadales bacterium]MDP6973046.1 3-hydroxyisobutyrate dehydrogenase [Pseudomonadales bacterium]|tara:strand:+ start:1969 stop:2862 length:894 start_codon:yes stop_codon:yes gene_type:complete
MSQKIGFVGLGNMGGPMAGNLAAAGYEVKVFDLVNDAMLGVEGVEPQSSAVQAASDVDVFISMLPAGRHVAGLYLDGGVLDAVSGDTLLIDCSTIDPETARMVASAAGERGVNMLDAPVSGGIAGAVGGTLTFIVGGREEVLEQARPVLEVMGANIFHAGENSAGQVAKICNNMLLAVLMAGTSEALALGVANGLDPAVLSEVMKQSSGGNWALNVYNPYPGVMEGSAAGRDYEGGFLVDLMVKDLGLAMDTAQHSASSVPMGSLAHDLYRLHRENLDAGSLDFSSIQWFYKPELRS